MKNRKKLILALGPVLIAILLLAVILLSPIEWLAKPTQKQVERAASSMSANVIKGNALKNTAMETEKYMPFFGSSELSRVNAFHPSVLARKYERNYTPFLLGAPGTQSLSHFFLINSMKDELQERPVVFIISPQWFVKDGLSDQMFSLYFSPLQTYQWILNLAEITEDDQYLAQRLLHFTSVNSDTMLSSLLKKIEAGHPISKFDRKRSEQQYKVLSSEDAMFGRINIASKEQRIKSSMDQLPQTYELNELETLADKIGAENTSNNKFEIANNFYSQRIAPLKGKLENSQTKFNYVSSPEFADFQLVLNEMAKNKMKVLFVIPPVNQRWSDYTGLSQEMLNTFSVKIKQQLQSQGFDQIADYTKDRDQSYFMEDTIHLGWRGWLTLDQDLQKFLEQSTKPTYTMDNEHYLSPEWQKQDEF